MKTLKSFYIAFVLSFLIINLHETIKAQTQKRAIISKKQSFGIAPTPATPTYFTVNNNTSVNYFQANWNANNTPANTGAAASGYLVVYAPSGVTLSFTATNGTSPAVGTGCSFINVNNGYNSNVLVSGLSSCTLYNAMLIPYTWDGSNVSSYNYLTSGALTASVTTYNYASLCCPTVTVTSPTAATLGATITSLCGTPLIERGTTYSTTSGNLNAYYLNQSDGGTTTGVFTTARTGFSPQTLYYYGGYAKNNQGASFSSQSSFYTWSSTPLSTSQTFTGTASSNQISASWTAASYPSSGATQGGYILVYAPSGSTPSISSSNGTTPSAGVGTLIVLPPTNLPTAPSTTKTITGLTNGVTYNFLVVPYTWDGTNGATYNYLIPTAPTATQLAFTSISSPVYAGSSFSVTVASQTNTGGSVNVNTNTAITLSNTGGGSISGNSGTINSGSNSVTIGTVTLSTPATGVTLTASGGSLTNATSSSFTVYGAIPTTLASNVTATSKTTTGMTVGWTNGNGAGRIVVARLSTTTAVAPTLGSAYTPSTAGSFTGSTATGTGNIVVYNGTGNSIAVTGLTANTAYAYDVYEYNGSTGTYSYSGAATLSPVSTLTNPTLGTFSNISKMYGNAPFTLTAPTSNSAGSFSYTSSDPTIASISGSTVTILKAGSVTITATQAANGNYASGSTTATLTINQAAITITANNVNKTYGSILSGGSGSTAYSITSGALQNSETIGSISIAYGTGFSATASVGTYTGSVTPSAATGGTFASSNYSITYVSGTLTVNTQSLTITANAQSTMYGSALVLGTTSFTTNGLVNGDAVTSVALQYNGSATVASTTAAGSYSIVPGSASGSGLSNYSLNYVNGVLTVNKATPNPTFAISNPTITYSGTQVAANVTVSGGTAGTVANIFYNGSSTIPTTAGTYAITVNYTPTDAVDYNSLTGISVGNFVINKATPSITTAPTANTIAYNLTLASSTLSGGVASVAGSFAFTNPSTVPGAGTTSQGYTFTPSDLGNFNTITGLVNVTVIKPSLPAQTIVASGPTTYCSGGSLTLSASNTANVVKFVGSTQEVTLQPLGVTTNTITFETWVYTNGTQGLSTALIFARGATTPATGLNISSLNNNLISYHWNDNASTYNWVGGPTYPLNTWFHVALVIEPTKATVYLNGVPYVNNVANTPINFGDITQLASDNFFPDRYFNGMMKEVRIWNTARTQAQIQASMATSVATNSNGLIAYYKLDEGTGATVVDATGNYASGSLVGGPTWTTSTSPIAYASYLWSPGGATTQSIPAFTNGNYSVTVTDGYGNVSTTPIQNVTVNTSSVSITGQPSTITQNIVPNGTSTALSVTTVGTGSWTYQWYSNTTASNSGGTSISGANGASYTPLTYSIGTLYYYCVVTGSCNTVTSNVSGAITIKLLMPQQTIIASGPTTFCNGSNVTLSASNTANIVQFNGSLQNANLQPLGITTNTVTFEMWVYANGTQNKSAGLLFARGSTTPASGLDFASVNYTSIGYHWNDNADTYNWAGGPVYPLNTWFHVALVIEPTKATVYLNGVPYVNNVANAAINFADITQLGYDNNASNRYFNGKMKEVRIWNTARTQAQILASMSTSVPTNSSGLLAYYKLDEGSGTSLIDATGNFTYGTLLGSPTWTTSTSPIPYASYIWSPGGVTTQSITPTTSGNYFLSVTDCYGNVSTSNQTVTVNPSTSVAIQPSTSAQTLCLNSTPTALGITAVGSNLTYQWYSNTSNSNSGGTSIAGATSSSFSPSISSGTSPYYYCVVGGDCGSPATSNVSGLFTILPNGTWAGSTTNWSVGNNWCGGVPTSATNAVIPAGYVSPTITATSVVNNLTIASGASVTVTGTLQIGGSINNSGTLDATGGTIQLNGTSAQTLPAAFSSSNTISTLIVSNPAGVTLGGNVNINSFLHITTGNLNLSNYNITLNSTATTSGQLGTVAGSIAYGGIGRFISQTYINSTRRGYRNIGSGGILSDGSIFDNWQEGGANTVGYGTQITGSVGYTIGTNPTTGFDYTVTGAASLFTYNTSDAFVKVPSTKTPATNGLLPFVGYYALLRGDRTYDLFTKGPNLNVATTTLRVKGKATTGTVTLSSNANPVCTIDGQPVSSTFRLNANKTPVGQDHNNYGFSLVANPYPCAVNWASVYGRSIGASYSNGHLSPYHWIWNQGVNSNAGGWVTVSNNGLVSVTPAAALNANTTYIQPGESFYIWNDNSGNDIKLEFQESDKYVLDASQVKKIFSAPVSIPNNIHISLLRQDSTLTTADGAVVAFDDNFSNVVDVNDAGKFANDNENIAIQRESQLSIECRKNPTAIDSVPLAVWNLANGKAYSIKVSTTQYDLGLTPYLHDKLLGTYTPIPSDSSMIFNFSNTADTNTYLHRFSITFNNAITLPFMFVNTKVNAIQNGNNVEWRVGGSNVGATTFLIERSSDGKAFVAIGTVDGSNITNNEVFSYLDKTPLSSVNYYRVKAIESGQVTVYSPIVSVYPQTATSSIILSSNILAEGTFSLIFNNVPKGSYAVVLYGTDGKKLVQLAYQHDGNNGTKKIALSNISLSKGIYLLHICNDNFSYLNEKVFVP